MASIGIQISNSNMRQDFAIARTQLSDGKKASAEMVLLRNFFRRLAGGLSRGTVKVSVSSASAAKASGTLTLVSAQAGDTVLLNGQTLTAVTGTPTANQFKVGVSDTADAASLANAIASTNNLSLVSGLLTATSALGVVTVSALRDGKLGNAVTMSATGGNITASGARLTGGTGYDAADVAYVVG